jgi:glycosyltransferase involved in cell wall biosynthesis
VTVSLNAAATIGDTLASVALQAVDFDIEHICVDGGSGDGTRSIIDRWAGSSSRLRRVFEPDKGIFDAMNKGLAVARGEYVLFLNADDFLTSAGALASALRGLRPAARDNPDLIAGNVCMGRLGGRGIWRHRRVPRLLGRVRGLYPLHQAQLLKRRLLNARGGFDSRLRLAADVTLYYDLERDSRLTLRCVNEDLTFMRAGGAANAGLRPVFLGTLEIYRHLVPVEGFARAALMVVVKSLQSFGELRYGKCHHLRWFSPPPAG